MKRIKKKNRKKFYFTYLLASIVIILIIILAILLMNLDQFSDNSINKEKITEKAKNHDDKKEDKETSDSIEPTIIDTGNLNNIIEDAQNIDRNCYTDESLFKLDQALENAKNTIQNNGNQQEINDVTINLVNAIITLEDK